MSKNIQILIVCSIMVLLLGAAGAYTYISSNRKTPSKRANTQTTPSQATALPNNSELQSNLQSQNTNSAQNSSGLSVIGSQAGGSLQSNLGQSQSQTSNTPNTPAYSEPTPAMFADFEQYQDSPNALYAELKVGTGTEAKAGKKVAMIYKGWLTSGVVFDQSRPNQEKQIEPFVFELGGGQVIAGWEQGIAGMKVGGIRRLIVPPAVGYGAQGQGSIPPNALLVFDVQMVDAEE